MTAPAVDASMIRVERSETPASPDATEAFIAKLDTQPGVWLGCDVEAEGLYERQSMGCADPSLGFFLDGNELRVLALTPGRRFYVLYKFRVPLAEAAAPARRGSKKKAAAPTPDEVRQALLDAWPNMDATDIEQLMERAYFVADLAGMDSTRGETQ